MPFTTYPLNRINYNAEDAELYSCTRNSGIYAKGHFQYSVTGADNNFSLGKGIAWIRNSEFSGKVAANKSDEVIQCGLPDSSLPRIDVIAIRFSKDANATEYVIKKGIPANTPTMPAISQTETIYELYLYKIHRPVGATVITHSQITDLRLDPALCGVMGDSVTRIDTSAINSQFTELLNSLKDEIDAINKGTDVMLKPVYDPRGKATDIFAAIPGRDLLDNSYFTNLVNQRGAGNYSGGGVYSIDRWKVYLTTLTVSKGSCSILRTGNGGALYQCVESDLNSTYTFTVKTSDGIVSVTGIPTANSEKTIGNTVIRIGASNTYIQVSIWTVNTTNAVTLYWAKLEEGSIATPYVPKGYGAELAECRRYFIASNIVINTTEVYGSTCRAAIYFPVQMRTVPTITKISENGTVNVIQTTVDGFRLGSDTGNNYLGGYTASADL